MADTGDFSISLDSTRLDRALHSLRETMLGSGKDISNLLVDEQRRLARTIVNVCPPGPGSGAKKIGEFAIEHDIHRLVSEASPGLIDKIGSRYGVSNISAQIVTKKGDALALEWAHLDPSGARLAEYHRAYLNQSGRIPKLPSSGRGRWVARVVAPTGARDAYIKTIQTHVGRWKAKWAYGASLRGDRYPAWISRHFSTIAQDSVTKFDLADPAKGSITFGGRGPDFKRNAVKVASAMKFRSKLIMRKIRMMINGYRKDMAGGNGVSPKADQEARQEEYESVE